MTELIWWQKAFIGALGGLGLAMLKLIEARFYLDSTSVVEPQAAYLTYACYMVLGSLGAVFLTDHEGTVHKVRRSAFILGLLAPSVLLAIANQPHQQASERTGAPAIPRLSSIFISSAQAQGFEKQVSPGSPADVVKVPRSSIEPTFKDAFYSAWGRKDLPEKYVYIVGATPDKQKAIETSKKLNTSWATTADVQARVIQLENQSDYFVVVGGFGDKGEAAKLKDLATDATSAKAISVLTSPGVGPEQVKEVTQINKLISEAKVVPAKSLLKFRF